MPDKLTPKQARFVTEYLTDYNATQAAIRAGYSTDTANSAGPRLLVNVRVSEAIAARAWALAAKVELSQEWVLRRLMRIADADPADYGRWGPRGVTMLVDSDALTSTLLQACSCFVEE